MNLIDKHESPSNPYSIPRCGPLMHLDMIQDTKSQSKIARSPTFGRLGSHPQLEFQQCTFSLLNQRSAPEEIEKTPLMKPHPTLFIVLTQKIETLPSSTAGSYLERGLFFCDFHAVKDYSLGVFFWSQISAPRILFSVKRLLNSFISTRFSTCPIRSRISLASSGLITLSERVLRT